MRNGEKRRWLNRMEDTLNRRHEKSDEEPAKKGHGASPDVESPESEFERFENLTREIMQVPKKELDEKRKERADDGG